MVTRTLDDLVKDLEARRRLSDPSPIVLLGAGASAGAGLATMTSLYKFLGVSTFEEFVRNIEPRSQNERYRLLTDYLQTPDPLEVTPGYHALAALCEAAYVDVVLTTNFDPLLDDALVTAGMRRRDYLLLANGSLRPDRMRWLLASRSPRVKVVKLHGDLFHRFMAWTPAEMRQYVEEIEPALDAFLSTRDFIVSGSGLRDERIRRLVRQAGGEVWYLTPGAVPPEIADLPELRAVAGPEMGFETVFPAIAKALAVAVPDGRGRAAVPERETGATTTDDLIAAAVGLAATPDGAALMTGFVLANPRVIVTDGYSGNTGRFDPNAVTVIASTGRRCTTRARHLVASHPFGPWVLEVPADLTVEGLELHPNPVDVGETVHVAVSAGERVGLSTGNAVDAVAVGARIEPIGWVDDLAGIRAAVRPGSSGAPVVDTRMRVRGFIVAGNTSPENPFSFMYPSEHWHAQLESAPAPTTPRRPRATKRRR